MPSMRWVGLDVHARDTCAGVFDQDSGEVVTQRIAGGADQVIGWLETLEGPWRAVYEAGPTGYGLARKSAARGMAVEVCAPGLIPRRPNDHIKTDPRDAIRLARLLAAGELVVIRVPTPAEEQMRDLVRAREDVRLDLMRARHRLSKFLLRREITYPGPGRAWTASHRDWLVGLRFDDPASEITFTDMLHAHDGLICRRERLQAAIVELVPVIAPGPVWWAAFAAYAASTPSQRSGCARRWATLERFAHPRHLASYLGLVPREDSSGERRRQGAITKAGSRHARRLLVEAAWHYRRPPRVSAALAQRHAGQEPRAVDLAWRAQRRLHGRWRRLETERGKRSTLTAIAVARELSGFCWELARVR